MFQVLFEINQKCRVSKLNQKWSITHIVAFFSFYVLMFGQGYKSNKTDLKKKIRTRWSSFKCKSDSV